MQKFDYQKPVMLLVGDNGSLGACIGGSEDAPSCADGTSADGTGGDSSGGCEEGTSAINTCQTGSLAVGNDPKCSNTGSNAETCGGGASVSG
ncbi:MAG: hypothetical protein HQ564_09135 [Candidatus Saganbacteria bacterium]|nr:hypothetical protein [Candidatus Saganbacteria bacterium]